ncbi:unnamed protein product, partial [Symbiodinium sp. CCMP2456]
GLVVSPCARLRRLCVRAPRKRIAGLRWRLWRPMSGTGCWPWPIFRTESSLSTATSSSFAGAAISADTSLPRDLQLPTHHPRCWPSMALQPLALSLHHWLRLWPKLMLIAPSRSMRWTC